MTGNSTLGIGLTMFLRDQFSGPAGRIRTSSEHLVADLRRVQSEALRDQRNLNAGVAMAGVAATAGLARMINKASEFGYEMAYVKSITTATVEEGKGLTKLAMDLGQATMFTGQQVAEGMRFMAMAGMSAKQVKDNIAAAVMLAGATNSKLEGRGGSADIMTNVMKQFSIDTKYSANVADILSYGANKANTDIFELGEAIKYAGATSMDLNVSLQESVAMIMALSNAGIQGSMAGVAMENAMRYMAAAVGEFGSGRQKQALDMLGLSREDFTDANGNLKSMVDVIRTVGNALDNTMGKGNNVDKQSALQAIFGVRGKRASSLLIRNLKDFDSFVGDVSTKSAGNSVKITNELMNSLKGGIDQMTSAWGNMWASFAEAVTPFAKWLMSVLERTFIFLQKVFQIPYLGDALSAGIVGFTLMITAATAFKAVVSGLKLMYLQSQMAVSSLTNTTVAGFSRMTGAVNGYTATMSLANAKTMAGAGLLPGQMLNNRGQIVNTVGRGYVSNAAATAAANTTKNAMLGGGLVSLAASLKFGASRLAGFLMGPWGIALMVGLPMILGVLSRALGGNKAAVDKNTDALNESSKDKFSAANMSFSNSFVPIKYMGPRMMTLAALGERNMGAQTLGPGFAEAIESAIVRLGAAQGGDIVINLDGTTIFRAPKNDVKTDFKGIGVYY